MKNNKKQLKKDIQKLVIARLKKIPDKYRISIG